MFHTALNILAFFREKQDQVGHTVVIVGNFFEMGKHGVFFYTMSPDETRLS